MEKLVLKGIMAILPIYVNGGNDTLVYTKEGIVELEISIRTVIRKLCEYYHLDLRASKKSYGNLLSSKYHPPLPFNKEQVFIQIKTRIPIGKHDGAHGFVNLDSIKKIKPNSKNTIIELIDGKEIEVLVNINTVNKYMNNGEIVKKLMKDSKVDMNKDSLELYNEGNSPATKSDIALLYMKMLEIREKLE